jgi:glutathione peroxidase
MKLCKTLTVLCVVLSALASPTLKAACPEHLNQDMRKLHSKDSVNLCDAYAGKPMLVVNTASHCGYTKQFAGLEQLHQSFGPRGLSVAGFSSNDFRQEASSEEEAAEVCYVNYGVTFDMYAEIPVTGDRAHPLFKALAANYGAPKWNFSKYLLDRDGKVVASFPSATAPNDPKLLSAIEALLQDPS